MVETRAVLSDTANLTLLALVGGLLLERFFPGAVPVDFLAFAIVVAGLFLLLSLYDWRAGGGTRAASVGGARTTDGEARAADGELLVAPVGTVRGRQVRVVDVVLAVLVAWGFLLRVWALGEQSFWMDEAITTNAAIALLEHGRPVFPSGVEYWRAFPHTLLVAGSMALFGTTAEWAARFPSAVMGAGAILATYWLGREVGGRRVGLVAAVLVTFLTWEVAWGRQARMYQQLQLLYAVALVLLIRFERAGFRDRRTAAALLVVVALAMATHPIAYVLVPVAAGYVVLVGVVDERIQPRAVVGVVAVGALLLVGFRFVGLNVLSAAEQVLATETDYAADYLRWLAGELPLVLYLGVVGAVLPFLRGRGRTGVLLLLAVLPAAWVLACHTQLFASRYLYFGVPVLAVWSALAVERIGEYLTGDEFEAWLSEVVESVDRVDRDKVVTWSVVGLVLLLVLVGGFTGAPRSHYALGTNAPQPDFKSAYEYVNEHRQPGDAIVAGWTPPAYYYGGDVAYWLAHDYSALGEGWTTRNGVEVYAGAEPIRSASEFERALNRSTSGSVWIVLDPIALGRQNESIRRCLRSSRIVVVGEFRIYEHMGNIDC